LCHAGRHDLVSAVVTGEKGDAGPGMAGGAAQVEVLYRGCVPGSLYQAAFANHLVGVQQAVGPVTVGHTLHAGKMVRGEDRLVGNQFPEIRHVQADMIDYLFRHPIPQFTPLGFFCLAGEVKAVGAGDMAATGCQGAVDNGGNLEGQWYLLGQFATQADLVARLQLFRIQHHGTAKARSANTIEPIQVR